MRLQWRISVLALVISDGRKTYKHNLGQVTRRLIQNEILKIIFISFWKFM
jgi:hypothetical protein